MASECVAGRTIGAVSPVRLKVVLDTNIVLDLFVFDDIRSQPLKAQLLDGQLDWIATRAMRNELERVLAYSHIAAWMTRPLLAAADVLASFDRHARLVDAAPPAPMRCGDPDDQIFIDLAVQHRCMLLSKDAAVLTLKNRLAALRVDVGTALEARSS